MKIDDLNSATNRNFKPFYKVPVGSTFQLYTLHQWNKYGEEEYSSNFLIKQDSHAARYCGHAKDEGFCTMAPTELVKQISNEDTYAHSS